MPNYIKIKIRRDNTANWSASNPTLDLGELGADMTKHGIKVGDGVTKWNDLPFCSPELVNNLITGGTDKALTAEQGKIIGESLENIGTNISELQTNITDIKENITDLQTQINELDAGDGVNVEDKLTSTSKVNALSANQGRVLDGKITTNTNAINSIRTDVNNVRNNVTQIQQQVSGLNVFGIGYTVDNINGYGKPTKITFADGVTANLNWAGTRLDSISASTGEVITMLYDSSGRITGRTVTK